MTGPSKDPLKGVMEEMDKLLHEPARLLLMAYLYVVEKADFVFLMDQTGLTAGKVSSHMRRLMAADYVGQEKSFVGNRPQTSYHLSAAGRQAFDGYREHLGALFELLPDEAI
jgi:DNA-binding MarR family transcriptional regulator